MEKMENEKEWKFQATMKMRFFFIASVRYINPKFPFYSSLERDTSTGSADYLFLHLFIYLFTKQWNDPDPVDDPKISQD